MSNLKESSDSHLNSINLVDVESLILKTLANDNIINDTWYFAEKNLIDHQVIVGTLKSLLVDKYVKDEVINTTLWVLTEEGQGIIQSGSPEFQVISFH